MSVHSSVCPQGGTPPGQGGTPARSSRGIPQPGPDGGGGTPARFSWGGGYPSQVRWGVPWPGLTGGYSRWGTPGVTPLAGVLPVTGQQMEYLIHHGWHASCVHAGGLSCFLNDQHYYRIVRPIDRYQWLHKKDMCPAILFLEKKKDLFFSHQDLSGFHLSSKEKAIQEIYHNRVKFTREKR